MDFNKITIDTAISAYAGFRYALNDGQYNLNIFGVRAALPASNKFDDAVCVLYKNYGNVWTLEKFAATVLMPLLDSIIVD